VDGLDSDNRHAWDLSQAVLTRLVADTEAFGPVIARLGADLTDEEFLDRLRRLNVIYDVLVPAQKRPT
jgi:hypothetical protein